MSEWLDPYFSFFECKPISVAFFKSGEQGFRSVIFLADPDPGGKLQYLSQNFREKYFF